MHMEEIGHTHVFLRNDVPHCYPRCVDIRINIFVDFYDLLALIFNVKKIDDFLVVKLEKGINF